LAAEGVSIRRIAAEVFGEARFRGRVERILRAPLADSEIPSGEGVGGGSIDVGALGTTAVMRQLFERRLAWVSQSPERVSMNELRNLFEVERRLAVMEEIERHQADLMRSVATAQPE